RHPPMPPLQPSILSVISLFVFEGESAVPVRARGIRAVQSDALDVELVQPAAGRALQEIAQLPLGQVPVLGAVELQSLLEEAQLVESRLVDFPCLSDEIV